MTGSLPPPGPSGVRVAGDRYQWLVAWLGCVSALRDAASSVHNPIVSVGIEVDNVGNVDDVVLWRRWPPHSYKQVKYGVDSRSPVNTDYLTAPSKAGGPSILQKIAVAWRQLGAAEDQVELAIVTNRSPDFADPLIAGRDARTRRLLPNAGTGGPRSARGQARAKWAQAAELTEEELLELLTLLDFDLARDREHLEETVKLTMLVTGLRGDSAAMSAGADWVAEQVVAGHRQLDLDAIQQAVDALALRTGPVRAIVSVATLKPDRLANEAVYAVDWVDRFDGADAYAKRRPRPPATWPQLQADIEATPAHLGGASHVAITGSLRLATAFTVGAALRMVTNTDVAVDQRGRLWSSDAVYPAPQTPSVKEYGIGQGQDIAIGIEVATPIADDVREYLQDHQIPVGRLVILGPPDGPRDNAIGSPEEACALAVGLRNSARRSVRNHSRIHLFLAGPMGLALLLGHRWNRVAPTVVYEDLAALGYEAAFTVSA